MSYHIQTFGALTSIGDKNGTPDPADGGLGQGMGQH